jgi:hypothetical protein
VLLSLPWSVCFSIIPRRVQRKEFLDITGDSRTEFHG